LLPKMQENQRDLKGLDVIERDCRMTSWMVVRAEAVQEHSLDQPDEDGGAGSTEVAGPFFQVSALFRGFERRARQPVHHLQRCEPFYGDGNPYWFLSPAVGLGSQATDPWFKEDGSILENDAKLSPPMRTSWGKLRAAE